tara:strand:+ start:1509 stop:2006 length:498 start_codon:yes stop_codon:yes gene_type:complete
MLKRLNVSNSAEFEVPAERLWKAISEPGNLNDSHPFCESNEVISWEDGNRSDRIIYLSGLNFVRRFKTWEEGVGYTLVIGEEGGPKSYVEWEITPLERDRSRLTISVYPHILAGLPRLLAFVPHAVWVKPRLESYLDSVVLGFRYRLERGGRVPRDHFGKHPWFS